MRERWICATALAVTAAIHLAVVPEHQREWPAAAAFFVVLALLELGLAAAVVVRPTRRTLVAGAAVSVASALVWAVSRTVGLPVGPAAREAVAAPDVMATALEGAAAFLCARLAGGAPRGAAAYVHT